MVSEPTEFSVEQGWGNHSQGNVLFNVLRSGSYKGRRTVVLVHWTGHQRSARQVVGFASTCVHNRVGRAGYTSSRFQTTGEITFPWLLLWVRENTLKTEHSLIPACPGCYREGSLSSSRMTVPSSQSHPAMEEDAFPTSKKVYLVLTSSQSI